MTYSPYSNSLQTKPGDLIQLVSGKGKKFIFQIKKGEVFQSHVGYIHHDDLINQLWGSKVQTHLGKIFVVLQPALDDLIRSIPRETQIMYPKDIGYILITMGIQPGSKIIEAGAGSGALTTALAYSVGPEGKVFSYEKRDKNIRVAKNNIINFGLEKRVIFKHRDIAEGFDETEAQSLFLDLPNPENYIPQSREALLNGGCFGSILPTTNQVSNLITALKKHNFGFIEISEILHRYYKTTATRFRPTDRMVAHTGYLIFARKLASMKDVDA